MSEQYRHEVDFRRLYDEGFKVDVTPTIRGSVFVAPMDDDTQVIVALIPAKHTSTEAVKAAILRYGDVVRSMLPLLGLGGRF